MALISSYPVTSSIDDDDFVLIDGDTGGTRRISGSDLSSEMSRLSPGYENVSPIEGLGIGSYILALNGNTVYKIAFEDLVEAVRSEIESG